VTHQTIPMNIQDYTIENLISGFLPQQIYCCFVEDEAFSGKQNKNPYCFKSFDLNNFVFKVNGVSFFTVYLFINSLSLRCYIRSSVGSDRGS